MKLTNKQLSIVVDMIYDKIEPVLEAKNKKEKEKLENDVRKRCEKHPTFILFKRLTKLVNEDFNLAVMDRVFYEIAGRGDEAQYYQGHTHVKNEKEFIQCVLNRSKDDFKTSERETKKQIEKKVIMASINTKDLQSLIEAVSKEFIK